MRRAPRVDILTILILVCIAAFFRFHHLEEVPIGLWRDEAANGLEALRILDGNIAIFYGTREPMFIYLAALSVALLGRTPLAIRVVAAIVGTATIPVTYLLVKELFRSTERRARAIACLTCLWLATSYWHISFSRLGFRGILLPLLSTLSFYLLWRGWNELTRTRRTSASRPSQTLLCFAASGLFLGLTMYTYTPARFLPIAVLPFLAHIISRNRKTGPHLRETLYSSESLVKAFSVFGLALLLVVAPLGLHFLTNPGSFFARAGVSVLGVSHDESLAVVLAKNALQQLGMFGFVADPNTRHDPAGRPAFDLPTLSFFIVGLMLSIYHSRETPYLFALAWFSAMLLPAVLTFLELPHFLRAIGTLPVAYVFPALGIERVWQWLREEEASFKLSSAFAGLLALCFALMGFFTYRDYFSPKVEEIELVKAFDPRFVEVASIMNQLDEPDSVWIIPLGPRGEQRMAYFVIDFLYQGIAPHRYVHVDEATLAQELLDCLQDSKRAMLLDVTRDYSQQPWYDLYVDSQGLIRSLLDEQHHHLDTIQFDGLDVLVFQLAEDTDSP
ncbi:MAG: hypothetical protein CEE40_04285 [Chloroflexi bacterium B3_Chlor]|nr:MAG: hypothetical protein CEE40_04285 [Chloroflexi bacterium B3_Chlor]